MVRDQIAEGHCWNISTVDELMAQLQAENRLLEELLRPDATDQL